MSDLGVGEEKTILVLTAEEETALYFLLTDMEFMKHVAEPFRSILAKVALKMDELSAEEKR